jgi:acyl-CoA synthetase (AMP-forming)/AMP-acid ligase II
MAAILDHPPSRVWEIVGQPDLYPRFVPAISWCEGMVTPGQDQVPQYTVRSVLSEGGMVDSRVQALIWRPREQVVWSNVGGAEANGAGGNWVSVRLARHGERGTNLEVVVCLRSYAGILDQSLSESGIRKRFRETVERMNDYLSGVPAPLPGKSSDRGMAKTLAVLMRSGILLPGRPDRSVRQLSSLVRWGPTVAGGYAAAAAHSPDAPAVIDEHGVTSFSETAERANRLANGLRELGADIGRPVAVLARNHGGFIESLLACGKLGVDVVLLNTGLSAEQIVEIVKRHKPSVLIADDEFANLTADLPPDLVRVRSWSAKSGNGTNLDDVIWRGQPTAVKPPPKAGRIIVLTSGTTGAPKGAPRPRAKGLGDAASLLSRIPLRVGERILVSAPLFHTWGQAALLLGLPLRAALVLQRKFDPEETLEAIAGHRCTSMFAVPVMLQRMLDLPPKVRAKYDTSSLRIVASSGSALSGKLVTRFMDSFGDILYNLYGSTEVSWASIADPTDLRAAPTTAGRPPLGTRVAILDGRGDPAPPGVVGRIFVGNDMLFDGYVDGASKEIRHSLMDTGDVGFLDADGRLFVSGRDDDMIVSGGENVFPRPVEELLMQLPEVAEAAVVGVPDQEYGQRLAAYLVVRENARLTPQKVRDYVRDRLARFSVPRDVIFVDELPRNATGKIVKRQLVEGYW